jgi:arylsulfatase A-like enzyme
MLMSGRSLFQVYDNLDSVATFPELFRSEGYATFGTGKWHQSREAFARCFERGRNIFFGGMSDHNRVPVRDLLPDGSYSDVREAGFSTDLFADAAIAFIDEHVTSGSDAPFLVYVSFTAPHDPRTPPEPFLSRYPGEEMPLPANYLPLHPFHNGWMTGRDEVLAAWPRQPDVIRDQLGEYFGLITHMDARIGDLLDTLDRNGLAENTIVVFAADNGLALGSHGLLGKQSLYEHSTHVPLLFSGPGIPQGESDALVYLFDIFPTLAEVLGMNQPERVEGLDLSTIWRGDQASVRAELYTAYEDKQRAVRDERWKLIRYPKLHYNQLFDLATDPHELRNLAEDPDYTAELERLTDLLEAWHRTSGDKHPLLTETPDGMEFDYTAVKRQPDRHQPAWVVDKYFGN